MSLYGRYLLWFVVASSVINVALAVFRQEDITLYFAANVISFLAITMLHVDLNRRARVALNRVGIALFSVFAAIVALKVVEILLS